MRLDPFLAPDDPQPADEKHFTESDIQELKDYFAAEKQRYETALRQEAAARQQAETTLHAQQEALHAHEMRLKAQEELRTRQLPEQLLGALNLSSEETLLSTLACAEDAFRKALEEGVRQRLSGHAPSLIPLPQKKSKPRSLSYQEAAANYIRDRQNH